MQFLKASSRVFKIIFQVLDAKVGMVLKPVQWSEGLPVMLFQDPELLVIAISFLWSSYIKMASYF